MKTFSFELTQDQAANVYASLRSAAQSIGREPGGADIADDLTDLADRLYSETRGYFDAEDSENLDSDDEDNDEDLAGFLNQIGAG